MAGQHAVYEAATTTCAISLQDTQSHLFALDYHSLDRNSLYRPCIRMHPGPNRCTLPLVKLEPRNYKCGQTATVQVTGLCALSGSDRRYANSFPSDFSNVSSVSMYVLEHQMFEPPPAALTAQATAIQLPPATHAVPVLAAAAGVGSATMPEAKAASAAAVVNPKSAGGDFSEDESDAGNEEFTLNTEPQEGGTAPSNSRPPKSLANSMSSEVGRFNLKKPLRKANGDAALNVVRAATRLTGAAAGVGSATKAKAASTAAVDVNPLMSAGGDFSEDAFDAGNEEWALNTVFSKPATAVTETVPETPDLLIFDAMKDTVGRLKAYCDTINTAVANMLQDCAQSLLEVPDINGTNLNDDILAHVATLQSDALILEAYDNLSITDIPDMDKLLTAAGNAPLYLAKVMRYLSELVTDLLHADEDNARTAGEQLAGVQANLKLATSDTEQAAEESNELRVRLSKLTTELKKSVATTDLLRAEVDVGIKEYTDVERVMVNYAAEKIKLNAKIMEAYATSTEDDTATIEELETQLFNSEQKRVKLNADLLSMGANVKPIIDNTSHSKDLISREHLIAIATDTELRDPTQSDTFTNLAEYFNESPLPADIGFATLWREQVAKWDKMFTETAYIFAGKCYSEDPLAADYTEDEGGMIVRDFAWGPLQNHFDADTTDGRKVRAGFLTIDMYVSVAATVFARCIDSVLTKATSDKRPKVNRILSALDAFTDTDPQRITSRNPAGGIKNSNANGIHWITTVNDHLEPGSVVLMAIARNMFLCLTAINDNNDRVPTEYYKTTFNEYPQAVRNYVLPSALATGDPPNLTLAWSASTGFFEVTHIESKSVLRPCCDTNDAIIKLHYANGNIVVDSAEPAWEGVTEVDVKYNGELDTDLCDAVNTMVEGANPKKLDLFAQVGQRTINKTCQYVLANVCTWELDMPTSVQHDLATRVVDTLERRFQREHYTIKQNDNRPPKNDVKLDSMPITGSKGKTYTLSDVYSELNPKISIEDFRALNIHHCAKQVLAPREETEWTPEYYLLKGYVAPGTYFLCVDSGRRSLAYDFWEDMVGLVLLADQFSTQPSDPPTFFETQIHSRHEKFRANNSEEDTGL